MINREDVANTVAWILDHPVDASAPMLYVGEVPFVVEEATAKDGFVSLKLDTGECFLLWVTPDSRRQQQEIAALRAEVDDLKEKVDELGGKS